MILNLLNTIAIAIGIGTSVNNTNFNNEKKARRNELEEINFAIKFGAPTQSITTTDGEFTYDFDKIYLGNTPNNYNAGYFTITNTSYNRIGYDGNDPELIGNNFYIGIFKINNYYNTSLTIELDYRLNYTVRSIYENYYKAIYADANNTYDQYQNLTMTSSFQTTFQNMVDGLDNLNRLAIAQGQTDIGAGEHTEHVEEDININIAPNSSYTVIVYLGFWRYNTYAQDNAYMRSNPDTLYINGTILIPNIQGEVVDIPGMMFTILTLPFSFISQAFNLTVFPGTPYQVNFSNLFLTIIAIFILLWLIKHIFK